MLKKQPMKNYQVRKNKALRTTTYKRNSGLSANSNRYCVNLSILLIEK